MVKTLRAHASRVPGARAHAASGRALRRELGGRRVVGVEWLDGEGAGRATKRRGDVRRAAPTAGRRGRDECRRTKIETMSEFGLKLVIDRLDRHWSRGPTAAVAELYTPVLLHRNRRV